MKLSHRVAALERRIQPPQDERRVILAWRDAEGRLTKVADSHPELPDDTAYYRDNTFRLDEGNSESE